MFFYTRSLTRRLYIGGVPLGGGAPVVVQSMTNTNTCDVTSTLAQINRLVVAGCELVRCAVPDKLAVRSLKEICKNSPIPIIADVHFNSDIAIMSIKNGISGLRINPGTIGGYLAVKKVVEVANDYDIPIRIGINSGSLPKDILFKFGGRSPHALVEAALKYVRFFEKLNFYNIKISLKSSSVLDTIKAYKLFAQKEKFPLHLGITEAGSLIAGTIKSGLGLGSLLLEGIGDTLRISLTSDPVNEVKAAWSLLRACKLRKRGIEIISCPTCSRTNIDLITIVKKLEKELLHIQTPLVIAVMGCSVNGPGEAKDADIGIAGGKNGGVLFVKGKVVKKLLETELLEVFVKEIYKQVEKKSFLDD